jgi:hypothetical protein
VTRGQERGKASQDVEGIMGAPVRETDDGKPSKGEPKSEPLKNDRSKEAAKDVGAAPSSGATEAPEPPWKRKPRRGVFEGDVAVVELRSRLALGSERIPEPAVPASTAPTFGAVLRLVTGVAIAAAVAGATGYFWGFRLSTKTLEPAPASGQANVLPALSPSASLKASNRDSEPPAARMAATGFAPVDARGAGNDVPLADAAQRSAPLPTRPQTVVPSVASRPSVPAADASEIAAKMKIGADLVAHGDITAARTMFQRAAEAGEAAGAFALAETYDPVVLVKLRLRGGITPDLALARSWYERARDLGSLAARERISRLAQLPQ